MAREKEVTLEAVLKLAKKLSPAAKLKLIEGVLRELGPIVEAQDSWKRQLLWDTGKERASTDQESSKHVVKSEGLWKDIPFDVSDEDIREVRRELSEAIRRRTERC